MAADLRSRISRRLERAGAAIGADEAAELAAYFGLMAKWNSRVNLTGFSLDPVQDAAIDRLVVEPVLAARLIAPEDRLAIDLGSGGGSPAVPIRLVVPSLRMVLVEAKARKCAFLRDVVRHLRLDNVDVVNVRFEEVLAMADLHEACDLVTIRAVRTDPRVWTMVQAFVRPGGRVFWFTSTDVSRLSVPLPLSVDSTSELTPRGGSRLVVLRKQVLAA